jgi:hypothetical protein
MVYPADDNPTLSLSTTPEGSIRAHTVGCGDGVIDGLVDELADDDLDGNLLGDTLIEEDAVSEKVCALDPINANPLKNNRSIYIYLFFSRPFAIYRIFAKY